MLQLSNPTPFKCSLAILPDENGIDCAYAVMKATFAVENNRVSVAAEQQPVVPADQFRGDPATSSLSYAGDLGLPKPATDILLRGHAYAPNGSAPSCDVRVKVGTTEKQVRVFGNRVWDGGLFGLRMSDPEPFLKMPLTYELAFGGRDADPEKPDAVEYEPRNPVGRGLVPKASRAPRKGIALPNLEDPKQLIAGPKDRPAPACFGPVCGHWEPRKSFAGTYDEAWQKTRAPYLPKDFQPRFLQAAPADLIAPGYLNGGEPVEVSGATPSGDWRFALPTVALQFTFAFDGAKHPCTPKLDTLWLEPDDRRLVLLWRGRFAVDKKVHRLEELRVTCTGMKLGGPF